MRFRITKGARTRKMAVIVKVECQNCEACHQEEMNGVLLLGTKKDKNVLYYHDLTNSEVLLLLSDALAYMSEQIRE